MKARFTLIIALFFSLTSIAQTTANLTIFSNTGKKFFVVLNGERQNLIAETNVQISGLTEEWYSCRVIAEDKSFNIVKNIAVKPSLTTTYRIKGKRKKFKLRYYDEKSINGASEIEGQYTVEYVDPNVKKDAANGSITVTSNGQSGSDVNEGNIYTDTEMTMTFPSGSGCGTNDQEVSQIASLIKTADFSDEKMKIATKAAKEKCMTIEQIRTIANALEFSDSKMEFVKTAYLNCLEQIDYRKLKNIFSFIDDKETFEAFLASKGRN